VFSENCIWTAPVWTDYISAPAEELPGTLQNVILKKDPPKCLHKSPLGGAFGGQGSRQGDQRGPEGNQKGAKETRLASLFLLWAALGVKMAPRRPPRASQTAPHTPIFDDFGSPLHGCLQDVGSIFSPCLTLCLRRCFAVTSMLCPQSPACSVPSHQRALSPATSMLCPQSHVKHTLCFKLRKCSPWDAKSLSNAIQPVRHGGGKAEGPWIIIVAEINALYIVPRGKE
jgi:hypothetical protein